MINTDAQLAEIVPLFEAVDRVAVDTEADSLHCYFEKLCLLQLSFGGSDYLVDPLAALDLAPLSSALADKELVLQGADFDLRLLKRAMDFTATRVFDTVVAARLLGIRAFSLAALVERYFGIKLTKGSQKANWAQRPLSPHMEEYAMNDTRYLLPLAEKLEAELKEKGRFEWFQQSCQRGLAQTAVQRVRDEEEAWRITGSGTLSPRASAILRALWQWRDREAQAADRPSFHILQNHLLVQAAVGFDSGHTPEFRHLTPRRRRGFIEAAAGAMQLPESEWPARRRRLGVRPTQEMERAAENLRRKRDVIAEELGLEPSFIAPKATVESIAADQTQSETLLVPWQRGLLEV
ncbi:MAG: HRDC domain-containing protein [Chthoniobacterales bacterium]|nr:HRDC domain-containing protein [Chthoniobacterales bacterium]